jgi:hypothetical protein
MKRCQVYEDRQKPNTNCSLHSQIACTSFSYVIFTLRVGNFRQKNNSAEDGIDGTNGYFRRNSGGSAEQKISEFCSEPFRGRDNNSEFHSVEQKWKEALGIPFRILPKKRKQLGFPFRGTKRKANFPFRTISYRR